MIKNFSKIFALILTLIFSANYYSQCTGCTVTNPVLSGNYTFASGSTVCFTSNATLGDITFENNSKLCVAPGVTVIIQNYVTTNSGDNITFEIGGTLQFNQVPTINANLTANVQSGGILRSGTTGNNNFTFNGTTNTLTNNGTVQVSVLDFTNSLSTNIVDNYGTLSIGSNINISGTSTTFRNWQTINIGQSFNMNSSTIYINCGTINTATGFNLGGGRVINTGNFNVPGGQLDLPNGSKIENYGTFSSGGTVNNNGTSSTIYNEGLFTITNYQGSGWLKGPASSSKKGFFETVNQMLINSSKVGPNLDFKRTPVSSTQATVFDSTPTYVTSTGTTTTQAGAYVTFDCRAVGNCSAPLVTNIGVCPNIDGTYPPQANDDFYTILPGNSGTTNVLANDFAEFGGAAATTSNVTITQVSTTNSGFNVNTSGIVSVAAGTPPGDYFIVYKICSISNPSICDTATVIVTVPLDSDGDRMPDAKDLDDDNDGILDTTEGQCINTSSDLTDGFDFPLVLNFNGNNVQSVNPYNGWGTETGGADAFNVIRVNGAGYSGGPDFAQSPTQYIDINNSSTYVYKNITLTTPTIVSASAWFANRESSAVYYEPWSTKIEIRNETTGITVAQGNTVNLTAALGDEYWYKSAITSVSLPAGTYRIRMFVHNSGHLDSISYCFSTDTDGDGTPDYLDTDSDGDECPDAVEGGDNITKTMLNGSNAIGSNISGTLNSPAIATVDAYGVPVITNTGSTFNVDGQAQGQTAGSAYTSNPAAVAGTASSNQTISWNTVPSAITLTGNTGTIQWQSSADNVTFTNISGATSASYSPGTLTSTTYYRAIISSVGGCTATSDVLTITVNNGIDAVNDTYASVTAGTSTTSVIANDKNIAGTAAVIGTGAGQVSISTSTDAAGTAGAWPAGFTLNVDGTITVAAGTAAGTYTLYYTICNQTAGTPCDTARVTLTVIPTVQADDDAFAATATQGISGATLGNVLTNDNYNGGADGSATTSNVNISVTTPATPAYAGAPVPSINTATGAVTLPPNTPAGSYTITYQICDKSGSPCDPATVTVTVAAPTIDAVNGTQAVSAGTTGTTSVLANDTYNGGAAGSATLANVNLTQTAPTTGVTLNTTTGMITVAAGTPAGTYVVTYQICDKVNTGVCDTATETVTVSNLLDSDGDSIPDINDLDDDNDGILDTAECGNILEISGFENISGLSNGNNIGVSIAPWTLGPGDVANVVQVDGAGGFDYGSSGPFEDADPSTGAGVLQHYLDIVGSNSFYQVFTIPSTTTVTYSGYFSSRDNYSSGHGSLSIYTGSNGLSGTVVDTSGLITISATGGSEFAPWVFIERTVTLTPGTYSFVGFMNEPANFDEGKVEGCMDTDNDGTPNYLDLDSDNDGCPDAIEGDENVIASQLNANGSINYTTYGGLGATAGTNLGVPNIVNIGGTADIGSDVGQGIGSAYNNSISSCFCYKPAQTTGTTLDTNHGITALGRAGADNSNWPMVRKGAWTILEAKTKGFVVNRLTDAQISAIPAAQLVEGMMVYNITQDCLQINIDGTSTGWRCFNTQTCPD